MRVIVDDVSLIHMPLFFHTFPINVSICFLEQINFFPTNFSIEDITDEKKQPIELLLPLVSLKQ